MYVGIGHPAYNVSDMQASLKYYCEGLGFKHAFSLQDDDGNPWIEYLHVTGQQFVELFYAKGPLTAAGISYNHLCLQVDDAQKAYEELKAKGVTITADPKVGKDGNIQFWTADPDGNKIELMQLSPDSPHAKVAKG